MVESGLLGFKSKAWPAVPEVLFTLLGCQQSPPKELLGGAPRGAAVKVTGDTWKIPDIVVLT